VGDKYRLCFGIRRSRRNNDYPLGAFTIARRFTPKKDTGKRLRTNDAIRTSPVRLIDENDGQIGVVELQDAKQRAREAELDLVEVAPSSSPPVCRIMDYGKWKYQQKKKDQKAQSKSKKSELKEVRLRPSIEEHDLKIKIDRAARFIGQGHKVQFTLMFRGRQNAHKNLGRDLMLSVADRLNEVSKIETPPRGMGRRMTMILVPDKKSEERAALSAKPAKPKKAPVLTPAADTAPQATPDATPPVQADATPPVQPDSKTETTKPTEQPAATS